MKNCIKFKIKDEHGQESPCDFVLESVSTQTIGYTNKSYTYGNYNYSNLNFRFPTNTILSLETDLSNYDFIMNSYGKKYDVYINTNDSRINIIGIFFKDVNIQEYKIYIEANCDFYEVKEIAIEEMRKIKLDKINGT